MDQLNLSAAVELFAAKTHTLTEAHLETPWTWGDYEEGIRFAFFRTYEELREMASVLHAARTAPGGQPLSHAQHILAQYHCAYRDLQAVLIGITGETGSQAPDGESWAPNTALRHILEAERGFLFTILYALEQARGSGNPPHELSDDGWDEFWLGDTFDQFEQEDIPTSQLLAYAHTLHNRVITSFAAVSDAELRLPAKFWETTPMSIQFRLHRYDSHMRQHTVQIEKTLNRLGILPSEAKRLLRLVYNALAEAEGALIGIDDFYGEQRSELARGIQARALEIESLTS